VVAPHRAKDGCTPGSTKSACMPEQRTRKGVHAA
jgi:hypothetical protein